MAGAGLAGDEARVAGREIAPQLIGRRRWGGRFRFVGGEEEQRAAEAQDGVAQLHDVLRWRAENLPQRQTHSSMASTGGISFVLGLKLPLTVQAHRAPRAAAPFGRS